MNLLLVYPPITRFERYSSLIGASGGQQVPLGIYYLAAHVRRSGHGVHVLDAEASRLTNEDILRYLEEQRVDVVGISSTTVAFHRALSLAQRIKAQAPDVYTVIGGPHVSSQPRHPMEFIVFDFAIPNEGEETLRELLDALQANRPLSEIAGLVHRQGGEICCNPKRQNISDIDTISFPAFDLIPDLKVYTPPPSNYKKRPVANIITSRGCPNQCTFCDNNTFGRQVRFRSAENIVDEIEMLVHDFRVREIAFVDDTFTLKPDRVYEIFRLVRARGMSFPWTCMTNINTVDERLLKFMRDSGCWHISFGIESGDPLILQAIRKKIALADVERVISWCRRLGILTKGFFIIGLPGETKRTIERTIDFACGLKLDDIVVTINTPIPGSDQFANIAEYGDIDTSSWSKYNYWNPVFVPFGLDEQLMMKKHREFYRRFYLRPRILRRYLLSFLKPDGLRRMISIVKSSRYLIFPA